MLLTGNAPVYSSVWYSAVVHAEDTALLKSNRSAAVNRLTAVGPVLGLGDRLAVFCASRGRTMR